MTRCLCSKPFRDNWQSLRPRLWLSKLHSTPASLTSTQRPIQMQITTVLQPQCCDNSPMLTLWIGASEHSCQLKHPTDQLRLQSLLSSLMGRTLHSLPGTSLSMPSYTTTMTTFLQKTASSHTFTDVQLEMHRLTWSHGLNMVPVTHSRQWIR